MRLAVERRSRRRLTWLAIVAAAAATSFAWAWSVNSAHNLQSSAAATVASRFPAEWIAHTPKSVAAFVLARALPQETPSSDDPLDWLSPPLLFEQARQDLASRLGSGMPIPRFERSDNPNVQAMRIPRAANRTANLLNDAQIASIKERLKLTSDQQQLWPSVEAALRATAWRGARDKLDSKTATLDPKGVEKLKTALIPFVKNLRAEQKDELRMIAHLMGLERLASQL
jgi:hypothetical protein